MRIIRRARTRPINLASGDSISVGHDFPSVFGQMTNVVVTQNFPEATIIDVIATCKLEKEELKRLGLVRGYAVILGRDKSVGIFGKDEK